MEGLNPHTDDDCTEMIVHGEKVLLPPPLHRGERLLYCADRYRSLISEEELSALCSSVRFPDSVILFGHDEFNGGICYPPAKCCPIYTDAFEYGFRYPLPRVVSTLLTRMNLAPAQLLPCSWRYLIGACTLWRACGLSDIVYEEFVSILQLVPCTSNRGFYFLLPIPHSTVLPFDKMVQPRPLWYYRWIYIYDRSIGERGFGFPVTFQTQATIDFPTAHAPTSPSIQQRIRLVQRCHSSWRNMEFLLSSDRVNQLAAETEGPLESTASYSG